jgi:hypothetical protein
MGLLALALIRSLTLSNKSSSIADNNITYETYKGRMTDFTTTDDPNYFKIDPNSMYHRDIYHRAMIQWNPPHLDESVSGNKRQIMKPSKEISSVLADMINALE